MKPGKFFQHYVFISLNSNDSIRRLAVPSFVRVFVINRIIFGTFGKLINIENLVNQQMKNEKASTKSHALTILSLLKQCGIKQYMKQFYFDTRDSIIIEMIFNKIILNKYGKEYNLLITYNNCNDNNNHSNGKYKNILFNSNDLMSHIFEYLEWVRNFNQDLFHCRYIYDQIFIE